MWIFANRASTKNNFEVFYHTFCQFIRSYNAYVQGTEFAAAGQLIIRDSNSVSSHKMMEKFPTPPPQVVGEVGGERDLRGEMDFCGVFCFVFCIYDKGSLDLIRSFGGSIRFPIDSKTVVMVTMFGIMRCLGDREVPWSNFTVSLKNECENARSR